MAQWVSMCTLTHKGCGFKPDGMLQWSFLAETLFNDLTLNLKDVFSTSSYMLVSLMGQWISMCTLTDKGCGFKPHGRLHWSYLAEKVSLMTSHLCSNVAEGSSYNSIVAFGLGKKAGLIYKTDKR